MNWRTADMAARREARYQFIFLHLLKLVLFFNFTHPFFIFAKTGIDITVQVWGAQPVPELPLPVDQGVRGPEASTKHLQGHGLFGEADQKIVRTKG